MKKFTFLFLIAIFQLTLAQTPSWQWARNAGLGGNEITTGVAVDASGNVYATGWYTSANIVFGTTNLINPGGFTSDIFVAKYDATGNVLWAKTFGGIDGDMGNGITVDGTGNVYVTGLFTSSVMAMGSVTLTNTSTTGSDIFVAKFNPSGNTVWAKSVGGIQSDKGNAIAVDVNGNVFVTGSFNSTNINFGTGSIPNAGASDAFTAKYDQNGNISWVRNFGGTGNEAGNGIAVDATGDVYITGVYSSSSVNLGGSSLNNAGTNTQDIFCAKYNSAGTHVWSTSSGGSLDDLGMGIAVAKNNVYVTGTFNSSSVAFGSTTLTNAGAGTSDILLAKYDLTGNIGWAKRAGGTDYESGNAVVCDTTGKVYMSGYFVSSSLSFGSATVNNTTFGTKDLFVTAYDGTGTALWGIANGSSYDESGNAVAVNVAGTDVIMGGSFNSPSVTFGPSTVIKGCGDDVLVAKLLAPAVGIKENYLTAQLSTYPNPTAGKFTIDAEGKILFYNYLGQAINDYIEISSGGKTEFDFSSLPRGVYFYKVISDNNTFRTGRIVIK